YLSRYSDTLITLRDRVKLAHALKADLFISIHCNWSADASAYGVEAFVPYPKTGSYANIRTSIAIALDLVMGMENEYDRNNRGVKFACFQVLREVIHQCPSVLLEVGFISNPEDALFVKNLHYSSSIINPIKQLP